MLQYYPRQALEQLEFEKIRQLLLQKCRTVIAKDKVLQLRFHTKLAYLQDALVQVKEYKIAATGGTPLPVDFTNNMQQELRLLAIPGAILKGEELLSLLQLTKCIQAILAWIKKHQELFPQLSALTKDLYYEKSITAIIQSIVDDTGLVRDSASSELLHIRGSLSSSRSHVRRVFDNVLRKLGKLGYLADIAEGYLNGRRTVAVLAEQKRVVKGIIHGESDSGKIVFIEPEETIVLNNEIYSLEKAEDREVRKILQDATAQLAPYYALLEQYYQLIGELDFIRSKALLAIDMNASLPVISNHAVIHLINAVHPLLFLHNKEAGKDTVPLNIGLNKDERILMISGPNAGGKTVAMKTAGLLQLMLQAGMLVPADERSEMGIFKQLFVHIGDTQSIENELSTYSAHLRDMKHFAEFANGKTLFFIDELGGGTDPNLGGAFAEAIVERLAQKHAVGIITTHYLNLKVMAGKVQGIINGAMAFDEQRLEPLYQLTVGKPGSSYTFAIAQRSGLPKPIIERAKELTERGHFKLDKMLHHTEQQSVRLGDKEQRLNQLLKKNEQLKAEYEKLIDKEKLQQHYATLKLQNKIKKEELDYLRDTERKFKQIIFDWKKSENKQEVISAAEKLLFRRRQVEQNAAAARKADKKYALLTKIPEPGDLVRNKENHQVGRLLEIKGRNAIVKIGKLNFTVTLKDWVVVQEKEKR